MIHLPLYIASKYFRSKRRGYLSFVSSVAFIGIALGVALLILVSSVMNGFEKELRERILTVASHITITGNQGMLVNWPNIANRVKHVEGLSGVAPFINSQAMLANGNRTAGTLIQGVTPVHEKTVSNIFDKLIEGNEESFSKKKMANSFGV